MKSKHFIFLLAAGLVWGRLFAANPIVTDVFTADPAAIVHDGRVYLYAGQDETPEKETRYVLKRWLCYSSDDMVNWKSHGSPLAVADFKWAKENAYASHVIERDGKFFWYAPVWMEGVGSALQPRRGGSVPVEPAH